MIFHEKVEDTPFLSIAFSELISHLVTYTGRDSLPTRTRILPPNLTSRIEIIFEVLSEWATSVVPFEAIILFESCWRQ